MLLPQFVIRDMILQRKLEGYPLYDPPYKIEERLLPRDKALENFEYFMRVKQERFDIASSWLHRNFGVAFTKDVKGLEALTRWCNRYAGLLLPEGDDEALRSYFTYEQPWEGRLIALNLVFDIGILFGETIIANHPMLAWRPTEGTTPRQKKWLREDVGSLFQRPEIAGGLNPFWANQPFSVVYTFVFCKSTFITWRGYLKYRKDQSSRESIKNDLLNQYAFIEKNYPRFDFGDLRKSVPLEEYIEIIDADDEGI